MILPRMLSTATPKWRRMALKRTAHRDACASAAHGGSWGDVQCGVEPATLSAPPTAQQATAAGRPRLRVTTIAASASAGRGRRRGRTDARAGIRAAHRHTRRNPRRASLRARRRSMGVAADAAPTAEARSAAPRDLAMRRSSAGGGASGEAALPAGGGVGRRAGTPKASRWPIDVDSRDGRGRTALMLATLRGRGGGRIPSAMLLDHEVADHPARPTQAEIGGE